MVDMRHKRSIGRVRRSKQPVIHSTVKLEISSQDAQGQGRDSAIVDRGRKRDCEFAVVSKSGSATSRESAKTKQARATGTLQMLRHGLSTTTEGLSLREGGTNVKPEATVSWRSLCDLVLQRN